MRENQVKDMTKLMLKSSGNNPYKGKLSREEKILSSIQLAKLCKSFADDGQMNEAMNVSSEVWDGVIKELKNLI